MISEDQVDKSKECSKVYMLNMLTLVACAEILIMNVLLCLPLFVASTFSANQMGEEELAWIMISFPVSNFIFSYFIGGALKYIGRTNMLWAAVILMSVFTALFGFGAM